MIFDNLPTTLEIIKIKKNYSNTEIKHFLPKIPFGCKVINLVGKELEI